jgi:hypothetical protein
MWPYSYFCPHSVGTGTYRYYRMDVIYKGYMPFTYSGYGKYVLVNVHGLVRVLYHNSTVPMKHKFFVHEPTSGLVYLAIY